MFHDISPYQFDNHYQAVAPDEDAYVIFSHDNSILAKVTDNQLDLPTYRQVATLCSGFVYLFSISERHFFIANERKREANLTSLFAEGYALCTMAQLRTARPKWLCFAAATACRLGAWYRDNRFCGRCGKEMHMASTERMMQCDNCGNTVYHKISPAVIVGIINGEKILLSKYAANPNSKRYALIAGFTEIGEPIEDTVQREVMEEVGLRVKNIRYYKSQPWAFSDTLLMGFFCEVDGSDEITLDKSELALAKWVKRSDLPDDSDGVSLTSEMIARFRSDAC